MKKNTRKAITIALTCILLILSTSPVMAATSDSLSFDDEYYRQLKTEYDMAIEKGDLEKQAELIDLANEYLDNYVSKTRKAVSSKGLIGINYYYDDFFAYSKWKTKPTGELALSVMPEFGPAWEGTDARVNAWTQLYNRHRGDRQWKNTQSMQKQFYCHVSFAGGWKTPWNLEPNKTNVNPFTCN